MELAINLLLITAAPVTAVRLAAVGISHILRSAVSLPLIWPGSLVPAKTDFYLTWVSEKAACKETASGGLGAEGGPWVLREQLGGGGMEVGRIWGALTFFRL